MGIVSEITLSSHHEARYPRAWPLFIERQCLNTLLEQVRSDIRHPAAIHIRQERNAGLPPRVVAGLEVWTYLQRCDVGTLLLTRDAQGTTSSTSWFQKSPTFDFHRKSRLLLPDETDSHMPLRCGQHCLSLFGYMDMKSLVFDPNVKDAEHSRWKVTLA
jgi:hypothetical protein